MQFSREHNQNLLVKSLNEAVKSAAIVAQPDFAELWQKLCINLIFADHHNGLIARIRPAGELPSETMSTHLKAATEAAAAGAPILAPITTEILTVDTLEQSYVATL